jgi:hypothetical protein
MVFACLALGPLGFDIDSFYSTIKVMETKSKRGGRREGAGRKPSVPPEARARAVALSLRPDEIERLQKLGDGSVTAGVRKLLAEKANQV